MSRAIFPMLPYTFCGFPKNFPCSLFYRNEYSEFRMRNLFRSRSLFFFLRFLWLYLSSSIQVGAASVLLRVLSTCFFSVWFFFLYLPVPFSAQSFSQLSILSLARCHRTRRPFEYFVSLWGGGGVLAYVKGPTSLSEAGVTRFSAAGFAARTFSILRSPFSFPSLHLCLHTCLCRLFFCLGRVHLLFVLLFQLFDFWLLCSLSTFFLMFRA